MAKFSLGRPIFIFSTLLSAGVFVHPLATTLPHGHFQTFMQQADNPAKLEI
jgi:hypothetical protein